MEFTYSDLKPGQLRLLGPVTMIDGSSISLEIAHFVHTQAPPYAAVSYTWGEGDDMQMVQLNKRKFLVRHNLWSCLYYLGLHARDSEAKYLWVDAICINQKNIAERNTQVGVMDEIYRNACYVSIWLGLDPRLEIYRHRIDWPLLRFDASNFHWFEYAKKLADHEYWSRYWVIQECLLARNIQLHCGRNITTWERFREVLGYETGIDLFALPKQDRTTTILDSRKHGALPLLLARSPGDYFSPQRPLDELIIHHRHSRCKDPRDRVFALLGLLSPAERASLERFFPNYSLSHDAVVVITLAHLREVNGAPVTIESRKLFQGLGVESKERQKKLISAAEHCHYYLEYGEININSDASRQERARYMALEELEFGQEEGVSENQLETTDDRGISSCNIL